MNHDLFYQAANARALGSDRVPQVWTVSQLTSLTRELVEGSIPALWIAGEVTGFRRMPAGHCFFTLKDERAKLACVMWRDQARTLPTEPPEGMAVHAFGYPTVYARAGRLQFVVGELNARGEGFWRVAFDRIRQRLEADGLLDPARKRPLPRFPRCVGVITSTDGAAIRDIVTVIRRRAPWTQIVVYPTRVQGDGAAAGLARALAHAGRGEHADVLIVGRGGGAVEDLWAFNDERVARAIAATSVPVISAVGHESDVTLADLVADRRVPTPSAAAEAAVPDGEALQRHVTQLRERLPAALSNVAVRSRGRLQVLEGRLTAAMSGGLERRRMRVEGLGRRLQALGPTSVLRRGYAVALDEGGRILRSSLEFKDGMSFTLRLHDGSVRARTEGGDEAATGEVRTDGT